MTRIASMLSLLCVSISLCTAQADIPFDLNLIVSDVTGKNTHDGTAIITASNGLSPYSYIWSNGATTSQIENLAPGIYQVTVTDDEGNSETAEVILNPFGCLELMIEANVQPLECFQLCDGSITILDIIHGNPPYTYDWDNGDGDAVNDLLCAGFYTVTVTDVELCVVSETYEIVQPTAIITNASSTSETINGGDGTAWVTPSGGAPPYTYQWSTGSTDSLITGLIAGTYIITITDATACTYVDSVQVEEYQCFLLIVDEVQHVFCHDSCQGLIFLPVQGGVGPFSYAWSNGDTSNIVFDLCAGSYSVTVTDLGQPDCASSFLDFEITQPDTFFPTIDLVVHRTDSTDGSIDITIHGGTSPYFPVWFGPNGYTSFDEDISGLEPGIYYLNGFDSHDCELRDTIEILDMTVGIQAIPDGEVFIYPNPATNYIFIDTRLSGDYEVSMFSATGAPVGTWQNITKIDVKDLVPGIYVVSFRNTTGRYIERIFIQ